MKRGLVLVFLLGACAGGTRRFPLKTPLGRDTDLDSREVPCRPDPAPGKDGKPHKLCLPEEYLSSFFWDGANNQFFRQIARFFAVDPAGDAVNVNAFDEVPDSAWFTNRIGVRHLGKDELMAGPCGGELIDVDLPDGAIVIDQGKPNGANPGFRIKMPDGRKYMLKADGAGEPERATGATAIATRLYHAAGWYAACDTVVYIRPASLTLTRGLTVTDNEGVTRPFDLEALKRVLGFASHRAGRVRFAASRWLPGHPLGPFSYDGTRGDDPNDIIPHEDRRDLRGAKLMAAWTNHFDSREQNSLDTWIADDPSDPDSSPGKVIHYYIDLGDCFGSFWEPDDLFRRIGRSYYFDFNTMFADLVSFGIPRRSWEKVSRPPGTIFGYFSREEFDPENWYGLYPNPAFQRMTERDGAWISRIIARFTDDDLAVIVSAGNFSDATQTQFLLKELAARRDIVLRRYLARLSPVSDLEAAGGALCGVDLARKSGLYPEASFAYRARVAGRPVPALAVDDGGRVCIPLAHRGDLAGRRDDDAARYFVVELANGQAPGILAAHVYDLGPERGFKLVGIERRDP